MIKKSLKVLYYKFSNYHNEIREFNYNEFNKFIITVLLKQFTRTDIILPAAVGFITILTSIQVITQSYVFFPQSNITAYVTFLLFQFAISIGTMFILPLITIIVINTAFSTFQQYIRPKYIVMIKLLTMFLIYYYVINLMGKYNLYHTKDTIYSITLWMMLYFFFTILYIAYKKHRSITKLTKTSIIFIMFFILLSIRPLSLVLFNTSTSTDYIRINHEILLTSNNCLEMMEKDSQVTESNFIINNRYYFESSAQGCILHKNNLRTGFATDYAIVIRKNINPITESDGEVYNYYSRIACYSSNCFIDNDIRKNMNNDEWVELIPFLHESQTL